MSEEKFRCEKCEKDFSSREALNNHNNSKHYHENKTTLRKIKGINNKKVRNWGIFIIGVILIITVAYYLSVNPNNDPGDKYNDFASCLSQKNVTMYGAFWCSHCNEQKEAFGDAFELINYVECSTPDQKAMLPICKDANIEGYPTWVFSDGTRKEGFVPLKELALASGCGLP